MSGVIVTGAASGIGRACSEALVEAGRRVALWDIAPDVAQVADALGVGVTATPRLKSIAHLGVRTRDFAFTVHGLTPPAEPFRVELAAPEGAVWAWGPEEAVQRVRGGALDFCYLVTQRRPRAALDVVADGPDAQKWLTIAQAFAGPPGVGR